MKKAVIGLVGLVVLLLAAALIAPSFIDWNQYKDEIAAQVKAATGREIVIAGDIDLALLPVPTLSVEDLRLVNVPGAAVPDMVRVASLRVRVALMPLLEGRIQVATVVLVEPVIELEILADGRSNWQLAPSAEAEAAAPGEAAAETAGPPVEVGLDSFTIENGTVVYRDTAAGTVEKVERLNAEITAESLTGPFRADGELVARGVKLGFALSLGRLVEDAAIPVDLSLTSASARVVFSGALSAADGTASGKLRAEGDDLAAVVRAAVAAGDGPALPGWLAQEFALDGTVEASAAGVAVDDIVFELGGVRATGTVNVSLGERVRADIALALGRIDLDRWLAMEPGAAESDGDEAPARPTAQTPVPVGGEAPARGFEIPAGIAGSFDLTVDAVIFRGGVVHQVRLSAELVEGEVTLSQATAQLPGGSHVSVFGFLTAAEGKPRFEGSVEAAADNFRGVLDWLQIDVSSVPPDRLRKFSFTGELSASPEAVHLTGIDLRLDTSRLTGGVTIALRERPAFGASLAIDRLNLDAYLPRPPAGGGQGSEGAAAEEPARTGAPPPSALALLETFDANLEVRIDRLTYRRTPAHGVGFDGTLHAGTLTVREARVDDLAGASARASGSLSGFTGTPRVKADFELRADDLTGLFRLAGIEPPVAPQKLGDFALEGSAETDGAEATFELQLALAGGGASLGGELKGLDGTPSYDLEVKASHPDAARLLETFLEGVELPGGKLGDIRLAVRLKGGGSTGQEVTLEGEIALLGGTVGAAGRLAVLGGAPSYDLELDARFPSLARLVGAFMPAFRAAGEDLGGLQLDAALEGDASGLRLSGIKGAVGPVALAGDIAVRLDGPRPKVSAEFNTGEIVLDQLLPAPEEAAATGGAGAATGGGEAAAAQDRRWSREPLDFTALEGFDAELVLTAPALSYGAYRLDNPRLAATLTDGVLELSRLSGVVFGGAFEADARLAVGRPNQINASLAVDGIELEKALPAVAGTDRAAGPVSLTAVVATAGASLHDFIDGLNGSGAVDGTVIVKVEAQERAGATALDFLGSLFKLPELTTLGGALSGVITAFAEAPAALGGTFTIDRGVIRTDDTRLQGRGLQALLQGTVALVPWQMDMDLRVLREADPLDDPIVTVELTGPLDSPNVRLAGAALKSAAPQPSTLGDTLEQFLPGVFGGGEQPQQPQPEQPEQPQPEQPELPSPVDILKGILEGFGN